MKLTESDYLELLDMYIELTEKQAETIDRMSKVIRNQAVELANLRNISKVEEDLCQKP